MASGLKDVVSLIDIGATVCDLMQCDTHNDSIAISLKSLESNQQRLHEFWIYHGGAAERHTDGYDRLHTFKSVHWSRYDALSLDELHKELLFEIYPAIDSNSIFSFSIDSVINTGLSEKESWGRWSDGSKVEIKFKTKPNTKKNRSVQFNLNAFVTSKNPEQTASVFINEKPVGNIQISMRETRPKQFTLALPDTQDNKYTIRFEIDKPTTPKSVAVSEDTRELGFGFVDMRLLPDEVTAQ